jgi:hypothetical protein
MMNDIPDDFWRENLSSDISKANLSPDAWEQICKIRSSPFRLVRELVIGQRHEPHLVLPVGSKGYLLDHPEVFHLSERDVERIATCNEIPSIVIGYDRVVFLSETDYEIVPPFFDGDLAEYAEQHKVY